MLQFQVFKILSYEEVDPTNTERVERLMEEGNMMVGHFLLSRNYFSLKPGQVYVFDKEKPFLHPKSGMAVSHAVMMIGVGHQPTAASGQLEHHMVLQNSEGRLFGINGIGKVCKKDVDGLYLIKVENEKPKPEPAPCHLTQAAEWLASDNVQVVTDVDHHHEEPMQRETMHYLISSDEVI
uniref:Uncharacterized protein n=1 Tax=Setaria italica TaxID=4555 RepID=K3YL01_SETIT